MAEGDYIVSKAAEYIYSSARNYYESENVGKFEIEFLDYLILSKS